eukprot:scaffold151560_cov28-Tisochrysis_lutea.AAC.2
MTMTTDESESCAALAAGAPSRFVPKEETSFAPTNPFEDVIKRWAVSLCGVLLAAGLLPTAS